MQRETSNDTCFCFCRINTVHLMIFACSDFREFVILGRFIRSRILPDYQIYSIYKAVYLHVYNE